MKKFTNMIYTSRDGEDIPKLNEMFDNRYDF